MDKELEERIERKKQYISDYLELSKRFGYSQERIEKTVDMLLEDLSKLMKMRKD